MARGASFTIYTNWIWLDRIYMAAHSISSRKAALQNLSHKLPQAANSKYHHHYDHASHVSGALHRSREELTS